MYIYIYVYIYVHIYIYIHINSRPCNQNKHCGTISRKTPTDLQITSTPKASQIAPTNTKCYQQIIESCTARYKKRSEEQALPVFAREAHAHNKCRHDNKSLVLLTFALLSFSWLGLALLSFA